MKAKKGQEFLSSIEQGLRGKRTFAEETSVKFHRNKVFLWPNVQLRLPHIISASTPHTLADNSLNEKIKILRMLNEFLKCPNAINGSFSHIASCAF